MNSEDSNLGELLAFTPAVIYEYVVYNDDDGDSALLYFSESCQAILGHPAEYFLEDIEHFWRMVHPEDISKLIEQSGAARTEWRMFSCEVRLFRADKSEIWVRLASQPTNRKSKGEYTWAGCLMDITSIKHADAALRRSALNSLRI